MIGAWLFDRFARLRDRDRERFELARFFGRPVPVVQGSAGDKG